MTDRRSPLVRIVVVVAVAGGIAAVTALWFGRTPGQRREQPATAAAHSGGASSADERTPSTVEHASAPETAAARPVPRLVLATPELLEIGEKAPAFAPAERRKDESEKRFAARTKLREKYGAFVAASGISAAQEKAVRAVLGEAQVKARQLADDLKGQYLTNAASAAQKGSALPSPTYPIDAHNANREAGGELRARLGRILTQEQFDSLVSNAAILLNVGTLQVLQPFEGN